MIPAQESELEAFYRVMAPYYDEDHANYLNGKDIEIYVELARQCGGSVLEFGCGDGRVLRPLLRAGFKVSGVDSSLGMLERLRERLRAEPEPGDRVSLTHGDARTVHFAHTFPLVIAPGHVLHSFIERADQRAWLRNVRRNLAPGGSFVCDTFQFEYQRLLLPPDWAPDIDRIDAATGNRIRRYIRCEHEPVGQRFRVFMRWRVENAAGEVVAEPSASVMQRWFTRAELENLLELEGFKVVQIWGTWGGEPFDDGSSHQIIRATL